MSAPADRRRAPSRPGRLRAPPDQGQQAFLSPSKPNDRAVVTASVVHGQGPQRHVYQRGGGAEYVPLSRDLALALLCRADRHSVHDSTGGHRLALSLQGRDRPHLVLRPQHRDPAGNAALARGDRHGSACHRAGCFAACLQGPREPRCLGDRHPGGGGRGHQGVCQPVQRPGARQRRRRTGVQLGRQEDPQPRVHRQIPQPLDGSDRRVRDRPGRERHLSLVAARPCRRRAQGSMAAGTPWPMARPPCRQRRLSWPARPVPGGVGHAVVRRMGRAGEQHRHRMGASAIRRPCGTRCRPRTFRCTMQTRMRGGR